MSGTVRIFHAALDEEGGNIILRGRIDPDSLDNLLADDYQREILPLSTISSIMEGFKPGGNVPDIVLGMRGAKTRDSGDSYTLLDPVYIVDGLQRVSAARQFKLSGGVPRLGAAIHFNTTKEWERDRFKTLNADRTSVAANVLVRNMTDQVPVIAALYSMCDDDSTFPLRGRVCWSQRRQRLHLISAVTLVRVSGAIHAHFGPGLSSRIWELVPGVQRIFDTIGPNVFRSNVRTFFQLIDECWSIKNIAFTEGAQHIKLTFLLSLCRLCSRHENFWRDKRLFIDADTQRKIKAFPVTDPTVQQLASSGGKAHNMLYQMMVEHVNRGKRTNRLKVRRRETTEA